MKYLDIDYAYNWANTNGYGENIALLDKAIGKFYYRSDNYDDEEIPDEIYGSGNVVSMPDKNDLSLGSRLVFRFVRETFPAGYDKVSEIFTRRGAYGRYKKWLIANDLLDQWHAYSNAAEEAALREWCADNGIELAD